MRIFSLVTEGWSSKEEENAGDFKKWFTLMDHTQSSAENKDVALTLLATAQKEKCSSLPVRAQKA